MSLNIWGVKIVPSSIIAYEPRMSGLYTVALKL